MLSDCVMTKQMTGMHVDPDLHTRGWAPQEHSPMLGESVTRVAAWIRGVCRANLEKWTWKGFPAAETFGAKHQRWAGSTGGLGLTSQHRPALWSTGVDFSSGLTGSSQRLRIGAGMACLAL